MRIGIDISILREHYDGIGFYTVKILDEFNRRPEHLYFLYSNVPVHLEMKLGPNFTYRASNRRGHINWILSDLKRMALEDSLDIFWEPDYILPIRMKNVDNVITVHDLSGYAYPEYADKKTLFKQRLFLRRSCRLAKLVLTDSLFSKEQIHTKLKTEESKIQDVWLSLMNSDVAQSSYASEDLEEIVKKCERADVCKGSYYLFVGTFSPRKNDRVIMEAFKQYIHNGGKRKLVLVGSIAQKSRALVDETAIYYKDSIVWMGYINEAGKQFLYSNAYAVLYPSRLEGFGIPLLEAMSYGKIVITSDKSSLPEVAGDAALYLHDVDNPAELCDIIHRLEAMDALEQEKHVLLGQQRVVFFENLNFPQRTVDYILHAGHS